MAPSTWRSRSRRADVTARVQTPTAGLARSRGASPARPCRPPHPPGPSRARREAGGDGEGAPSLRSATAFYHTRATDRSRRTPPRGARAVTAGSTPCRSAATSRASPAPPAALRPPAAARDPLRTGGRSFPPTGPASPPSPSGGSARRDGGSGASRPRPGGRARRVPEGAGGGSFPAPDVSGRGRRVTSLFAARRREGVYTNPGPASPDIPSALSLGSRSVPPVAALTKDGGRGR